MRTAFTLVGLSRATYNYVEIKFTLCRCVSGIQSYLYVGLQANRGGLAGGRVNFHAIRRVFPALRFFSI